MACVEPDGTLSESAKELLKITESPATPEDISSRLGQPLFKVRSSLRELAQAGLIQEEGGAFSTTEVGRERLSRC